MTRYEEIVKPNTPVLVVRYRIEDKELFEWEVIGSIPILSLIATMVKIQQKLNNCLPWQLYRLENRLSPNQELIITYNPADKSFDWFIGENVSFASMAGYLEIVKLSILTAPAVAKLAAQQQIVRPSNRILT